MSHTLSEDFLAAVLMLLEQEDSKQLLVNDEDMDADYAVSVEELARRITNLAETIFDPPLAVELRANIQKVSYAPGKPITVQCEALNTDTNRIKLASIEDGAVRIQACQLELKMDAEETPAQPEEDPGQGTLDAWDGEGATYGEGAEAEAEAQPETADV